MSYSEAVLAYVSVAMAARVAQVEADLEQAMRLQDFAHLERLVVAYDLRGTYLGLVSLLDVR